MKDPTIPHYQPSESDPKRKRPRSRCRAEAVYFLTAAPRTAKEIAAHFGVRHGRDLIRDLRNTGLNIKDKVCKKRTCRGNGSTYKYYYMPSFAV